MFYVFALLLFVYIISEQMLLEPFSCFLAPSLLLRSRRGGRKRRPRARASASTGILGRMLKPGKWGEEKVQVGLESGHASTQEFS